MYEKIQELCDREGITIAEMCRDTGIAQSTISNCKSRKANLTLSRAYTIARYFGVSIEYLMGKEQSC